MVWVKGKSGNPAGRGVERPFARALAEKIEEAGNNNVVLREIADNLLRMARLQDGVTGLPAIIALADRLDGKPAQESMVTVTKRDASDWTRDELVQFLQDARRQVEGDEAKLIEAKPIKDKSSE